MAKILCLETATTNCSVTLSENESVIAFREDKSKDYSHAERLHVFIEEVLKEGQVGLNEISAIAISKGPGSYTGLRIGVSAAKGICYALGIPLISIPTLESLALQVDNNSDFIVPMLDARRMEVYTSVFNNDLKEVSKTTALVLDNSSYLEYLEQGKVTFIGNGVTKFSEICNHPNALYIPNSLPSSLQMVSMAFNKYKAEDFEDVAYFEPYYLKDFIKT